MSLSAFLPQWMKQQPLNLPIQYLCVRIDLTDEPPLATTIRPVPAVYPGTDDEAGLRELAAVHLPRLRSFIAAMVDGRNICGIKSWVVDHQVVNVGVKEALELYELGWLAIRYLEIQGHGHVPQQQELWGVRNRCDDKEETEEDKKFMAEVMGLASVLWMREILCGVAAQVQKKSS